MSADLFVEFARLNKPRLERALREAMPCSEVPGAERFNDALHAAVFPGGKRLRAFATMIAARLGGSSDDEALMFACAIEFMHTSSLVLDDLPSMDDADLRRGKPALHLTFGEGTAILVGLALLNQSYSLFARAAPADRLRALLMEVSRCIGSNGMIGGQATELSLGRGSPAEQSMASRDLKTTALMRLMLIAGPLGAGCAEKDIEALAGFGETLGRVFQLYDDFADVLGDPGSMGKTAGQDARHSRLSPTRKQLVCDANRDAITARADAMLASAKALLARFAGRTEMALLELVADFILLNFQAINRGGADARS